MDWNGAGKGRGGGTVMVGRGSQNRSHGVMMVEMEVQCKEERGSRCGGVGLEREDMGWK